jgi:uncharacterized protein (TIGR03067 family)
MKTLVALSAIVCVAFVATAADESGFKPLFNGKDLTGWIGNPKLWSVEDGLITGRTGTNADNKINHNTFLVYTNGEMADFELRFSYKISEKGNSGVQYRSKVSSPGAFGPVVGGYQADFEGGKTYSGILYEERGRGILAQRGQKTVIEAATGKPKEVGKVGDTKEIQSKINPEAWNEYVVIAKGNHLQHFINGMLTADVTDEQEAKAAKSGALALQIHTGPPMTVQFKNIRLKNLGKDSASADTLKKFAGKWAPVEVVANGASVEREKLDAVLLTIDGNKYTSKVGDKLDEGVISVDDSTSPAVMDVVRHKADGEKVNIPAIYELKGDTLIVCYGLGSASRPKEFKSEADSGVLLVTYKRE